jgi:hypothetical protein
MADLKALIGAEGVDHIIEVSLELTVRQVQLLQRCLLVLCDHRLNIEEDLQSLFGLHVT